MSQSSTTATLRELVSPEETQNVKTQDTGPRAEVHLRGMISVSPHSCIFPYIEKR